MMSRRTRRRLARVRFIATEALSGFTIIAAVFLIPLLILLIEPEGGHTMHTADPAQEYRQIEVNDHTRPDPDTVEAARRHIEAMQAERELEKLCQEGEA